MNKRGIATALVLAIIFGLTTVGLGTYIVYDNVKTSSSNTATTEESTSGSNITKVEQKPANQVPTSDLFAFEFGSGIFNILKIENGTLYAHMEYGLENHNIAYNNIMKNADGEYTVDFVKVIDNAKRIKEFQLSTGVGVTFYVILNDGTVKFVIKENGSIQTKDVEILDNYKVDDIIEVNSCGGCEEYSIKYVIKLMDGTTETIQK